MNKQIPSVIALGIIIILSISIGGLLRLYSSMGLSGNVGGGINTYLAGDYSDDKSDYEEELMKYIKKYCKGNNNNDEKCSKYCKKLGRDIDLCEGRIITEQKKSSYDGGKCERLCSKKSDDFNKSKCNEYCGKYDKYNNDYPKEKKKETVSKKESTNKIVDEKSAEKNEVDNKKIEKEPESVPTDKEKQIQHEIEAIQKDRETAEAKKDLAAEKVKNRDGLTTFLIGADQVNIGILRKEIEENRIQIKRLGDIKEETMRAEDKDKIQKQVQEISSEQQKLNKIISETENSFSLFGWVIKLFR